MWAKGCEPHLPIKARLVRDQERGRSAHIPRFVHEFNLLTDGHMVSWDGWTWSLFPHTLWEGSLSSAVHHSCLLAPLQAARPRQSSDGKGRKSWLAGDAPQN